MDVSERRVSLTISPPSYSDEGCTVQLCGELTAPSCAVLDEALLPLLLDDPDCLILLDLTGISVVDREGLLALMRHCRTAKDRGASLRISGCSLSVSRALQASHLIHLVDFHAGDYSRRGMNKPCRSDLLVKRENSGTQA